ncbi:La_ribonucleoprotein [Hexamita inflata]|uniref:Putative n=1 Tax=Hexamita inflata TaxID=28002 RepID=A0AA86Q137_9EUKA|nr:La ribonucleoprotein [Hexamita inflata]CAI9968685.1 La ribonucleoprotein [Hexamita inflata]
MNPIKSLMEFYFGDVNLSRDQFNRQLLETNNNKVSLQSINDTFPKLKAMQVSVEQIKAALADSEVLAVDEQMNLSRKTPFVARDFQAQTLYCKGLPKGIRVDQIMNFLAQVGPKPELVSFHKNLKNASKGSFEMIFKSVEEAEQMLAVFGSQTTEDEKKCEACFEHFKSVNIDPINANVLNEHKDFLVQNLVVIKIEHHAKPEEEQKQTLIKTYVKGLIISIQNIGVIGVKNGEVDDRFKPASENLADQVVTRQVLQQMFQKFGEIKYIDFQIGNNSAYIRFKECSPDAARNALLEEGIVIGGQKVDIGVLSGENEEKYWGQILAAGDKKWKGNNKNNNRRK